MGDAQRPTLPACALEKLEVAPRVCGGDDGGSGGSDVVQLSVQQGLSHCRLGQIVDAGTPAAPSALAELYESDGGQLLEQLARLPGDVLSVGQMAGFVIGQGD